MSCGSGELMVGGRFAILKLGNGGRENDRFLSTYSRGNEGNRQEQEQTGRQLK